jgi:osmotically-inducible protein OsmY
MKRQPAEQFSAERRDREAIALVRRKLEHSGHKNLRRVKASIQNGTVTLTGVVATEADLEQAIEVVRSCARVDSVIDEIEIESDVSIS